MNIDSSTLRQVSYHLSSYLSYQVFDTISLQNRHYRIQTLLSSLSSYFSQSANSLEITENQLLNFKRGKVQTSHYENWNLMAQLTKQSKKSTFSKSVSYTYAKAEKSYSSSYFDAGANLKVGNVQASGSCSASLWKDKQFSPEATLGTKVDASLVSSSAHVRVGGSNIYGYASAKGEVGYVYAKAEAVFSKDEQKIEAGVGAAALRGSVSASFHLFGASITLTGSGSIGSAEANFEYSHKNREWQMGSKLGFICGLGFKVKVNY